MLTLWKETLIFKYNTGQLPIMFYFNNVEIFLRAKLYNKVSVKVKRSRYRPGVAQMASRGIALLFHERGTRRG